METIWLYWGKDYTLLMEVILVAWHSIKIIIQLRDIHRETVCVELLLHTSYINLYFE